MMNNNRLLPLAMSLGLLAGCAMPLSTATLGQATLQIAPKVINGGLSTQAVLSPYTSASINHLTVKLFKLNNSTETPAMDGSGHQISKDIPNANLGNPVTFSNLAPSTTYRIRAYAYADAATASLISTTDSNSYVDVPVTNDDRPALTDLPVKLIDQLFSGQSSGSFNFIPAGIAAAGGAGFPNHFTMTTWAMNNDPVAVALDGNGYLYTAMGSDTFVTVLDAKTGAFVKTLGSGLGVVEGLCVDSAGNVYVADSGWLQVKKITPAGVVLTLASGFSDPKGIALDSGGNVLVSDSRLGVIKKITPAGVVSTLASGFNDPEGIAVDSSNNIYVAEYFGETLKKMNSSGGNLQTLISQWGSLTHVAVDKGGNLYVGKGSFLARALPDGTYPVWLGNGIGISGNNVTSFDPDYTGPYVSRVQGIVVDSTGIIYVADGRNNQIVKIQ